MSSGWPTPVLHTVLAGGGGVREKVQTYTDQGTLDVLGKMAGEGFEGANNVSQVVRNALQKYIRQYQQDPRGALEYRQIAANLLVRIEAEQAKIRYEADLQILEYFKSWKQRCKWSPQGILEMKAWGMNAVMTIHDDEIRGMFNDELSKS